MNLANQIYTQKSRMNESSEYLYVTSTTTTGILIFSEVITNPLSLQIAFGSGFRKEDGCIYFDLVESRILMQTAFFYEFIQLTLKYLTLKYDQWFA
jgi:hypothetical protein